MDGKRLVRKLKHNLDYVNYERSDIDDDGNLTMEWDGETWLIEVKAYKLTE